MSDFDKKPLGAGVSPRGEDVVPYIPFSIPRVVPIRQRFELVMNDPPSEEEIGHLQAPFDLHWYDKYDRELTTIRSSQLKKRLKDVFGHGLVLIVGDGRIEEGVPNCPYNWKTKEYVPGKETTAIFEGALEVYRRAPDSTLSGVGAALRFRIPFHGLWPVHKSPGDAVKGAQTNGLSKLCNEVFGMCQQMYDGLIEVQEGDKNGENGIPYGKKIVTIIDPSEMLWEPPAEPEGRAAAAPAAPPQIRDLSREKDAQEIKRWFANVSKGVEVAFREFRKQWWLSQGLQDTAVGEMNLEQLQAFKVYTEQKWKVTK